MPDNTPTPAQRRRSVQLFDAPIESKCECWIESGEIEDLEDSVGLSLSGRIAFGATCIADAEARVREASAQLVERCAEVQDDQGAASLLMTVSGDIRAMKVE